MTDTEQLVERLEAELAIYIKADHEGAASLAVSLAEAERELAEVRVREEQLRKWATEKRNVALVQAKAMRGDKRLADEYAELDGVINCCNDLLKALTAPAPGVQQESDRD